MKKNIVIAFYHEIPKESSFLDKLKLKIIKKVTNSDIYHVELMMNNVWISAEPNGVTMSPVRKFSDKYKYINVEVSACKSQDILITKWLNSTNHEPYDWKAIWLKKFINIGKQNANAWICSELTSKVLQLYLVKPFIRLESSTPNPGTIYNILEEKSKSSDAITILSADELNKIYKYK